MKKRISRIFYVLCIIFAIFSLEASAEVPNQTVVQYQNTTIETACELENEKLYDDIFTKENNIRYYKFITPKKMSCLDFNVNSDARGWVRLLNSKGERIVGWRLQGKNTGFTYENDDPTYLLWDVYGDVGESEVIAPGVYYIELEAEKQQFSKELSEIRFHAMGFVSKWHSTEIKLSKTSAVYTGKDIALPKVKIKWLAGEEKYTYDENGKRHRIRYDCIIDRKNGKEIKSIKKIGSYLICNRSFVDEGIVKGWSAWGSSCALFTVTPEKGILKSVKSRNAGQLRITAKENKAAGRYQIQVSTDKRFKKAVQTVDTKSVKQIVNYLLSGQKYYVRVRYYKNVSIMYNHGKGTPEPIYGKWSKVKSIVCK